MVTSFFQLLNSHIPSCLEPDRMRWKLCKNGTFGSSSFYHALNGANGMQFPWKSIWGVKALQRVSFFNAQRVFNG